MSKVKAYNGNQIDEAQEICDAECKRSPEGEAEDPTAVEYTVGPKSMGGVQGETPGAVEVPPIDPCWRV